MKRYFLINIFIVIIVAGHSQSTTQILCDSVYKNKGYKLTITQFDKKNTNQSIPNTIFAWSKLTNGKYVTIYSDSVFSLYPEVRFTNFNNDNVKDILVRSYSDVRSNESYYLYLVDTLRNKLKKIKGFETIKNPNYLAKYNLIDCYVVSGQNWTSFYKINGSSVKDYGIVIYDNQKDDGKYEREYKNAIKKVLSKNRSK